MEDLSHFCRQSNKNVAFYLFSAFKKVLKGSSPLNTIQIKASELIHYKYLLRTHLPRQVAVKQLHHYCSSKFQWVAVAVERVVEFVAFVENLIPSCRKSNHHHHYFRHNLCHHPCNQCYLASTMTVLVPQHGPLHGLVRLQN